MAASAANLKVSMSVFPLEVNSVLPVKVRRFHYFLARLEVPWRARASVGIGARIHAPVAAAFCEFSTALRLEFRTDRLVATGSEKVLDANTCLVPLRAWVLRWECDAHSPTRPAGSP